MDQNKELTLIDLFAGVGGLSLGLNQAGFTPVLANEFDPSISDAYKRNNPNTHVITSDIRDLNIKETFGRLSANITVVAGGPPCQGYSQKGARKTILDPRNFLFRSFVEVVAEVNPNYFVMENVPNLLTSQGGYFKKEVYDLFESLDYTLSSGVLNAAEFGVPQNRRRAFIIGTKSPTPVMFPPVIQHKVTIQEAISDLNYLQSGEGTEYQNYQLPAMSQYQEMLRTGSSSLQGHVATNHSTVAIQRMKLVPPNGNRSHLPVEHHTRSIYSGTWARLSWDEQATTITTRFDTPSSGKFTHPTLNRAITVREAARLQSFPDHYHFSGTKTSQMKQVGNAVPPLLAQAVGNSLIRHMKENS